MAIWLTPDVYNQFPANGAHWLTFVDRTRTDGVNAANDFGAYCTSGNFNVTGFNSGYDPLMHYQSWDAYAACSMKGTQDCAGMTP
jgi:hypothetical protein